MVRLSGAIRDAAAVLWGQKPQGTLMKSWAMTQWRDVLTRAYWLPRQPLHEIRDYLGEEVALYAASSARTESPRGRHLA